MVNNDVFRISDDLRRNGNKHSMDLYVSPGFRYNEYDAVGDELWLVEMTAKVKCISGLQLSIILEMYQIEHDQNLIRLSLSQIQSDDPDLDIQDEFSVLFGFEFERTFKTERKIHVEFLTRSYSKDVVVEQGIFNEDAKNVTQQQRI